MVVIINYPYLSIHYSKQHSQDNGNTNPEEDTFGHLAELCTLESLHGLDITGADFFAHSIFQLLEVRGDQITSLALNDIDEINLNAVILIGDRCSNLSRLSLIKCHYQMDVGDTRSVDKVIRERTAHPSSLQYYRTLGKGIQGMIDNLRDNQKWIKSICVFKYASTIFINLCRQIVRYLFFAENINKTDSNYLN